MEVSDYEIAKVVVGLVDLKARLVIDQEFPAAAKVRDAIDALRDVPLSRLGHAMLLDAQNE